MRLMLVLACLHDADISALSGAYLTGVLVPDDPPIFIMKPAELIGQFPKLPNGSEP